MARRPRFWETIAWDWDDHRHGLCNSHMIPGCLSAALLTNPPKHQIPGVHPIWKSEKFCAPLGMGFVPGSKHRLGAKGVGVIRTEVRFEKRLPYHRRYTHHEVDGYRMDITCSRGETRKEPDCHCIASFPATGFSVEFLNQWKCVTRGLNFTPTRQQVMISVT
jgi:hypothetical protein